MRNLEKLRSIQGFILDLDGTTYLGHRVFPGVVGFLEILRRQKKQFVFLTNNDSQSALEYVRKLKGMGIEVSGKNVYTAGQVTASYLTKQKKIPRVFVLGTPSFERELEKAGCRLTDKQVDYVVVGFDRTLTYEKLKKSCFLIRDGAKFIASHPDINCPTIEGDVPDCGAICKAIIASTGVKPVFLGKPGKAIILGVLKRMGVKSSEAGIIGDRLYTDMKAGKSCGIRTILVLTGETTKKKLAKSTVRPDFVFSSIRELYRELNRNGE